MESNPFRAARMATPPAQTAPPGRTPVADPSGYLARLRASVAASAPSQPWLPRALLLPVMVWVIANVLTGHAYDGPLHEPFGGLTLVVHEAGHAAFSWFGARLLTVAGGTLFQLAVPLLVAGLFARQREWTGVAVALFWLGTSLVEAGVYCADARAQLLPRVSPWGGADDVLSHDWTYMLLRAQHLTWAEPLGGAMQRAGAWLMVAATAAAAWVVGVLARSPGRRST